MTVLEGALQLAAHGLRVHPVNGKVPVLEDWPNRASSASTVIEEFWEQFPGANVGVVTGDDGFFVVDVDAGKGGEAHLNKLTRTHGRLPRGPLVRSGGGGWHAYLRAPFLVRNSVSKVAAGIDIRGVAGQVVAPPSVHSSGRQYRWASGSSITEVAIPMAPSWLLDRIGAVETRATPSCRPPLVLVGRSEMESARRYLAKIPAAISGAGGHQATWYAALVLVRGFALTQDQALDLLLHDFNPRCEPQWSERELRHKVASAFQDASAEWGFLIKRRSA